MKYINIKCSSLRDALIKKAVFLLIMFKAEVIMRGDTNSMFVVEGQDTAG